MLDSPPPPQQPPCRGVGACCEHNRACRSALLLASSLAAHRGLELLVRAYPQLLFGGSSLEAQQPSCGHILRCMPCCVLCSTEHQPSCSPSAGRPHTCRFQRHFPWAQQKRATCDVSAVFLVCKGMTRLRCEDMSRDVCRPETQPQVQQSPPPPHHQPACCEHNRACRSALLLASSLAAHRGLELLVRAYPQLLFGGSSLEAQQPSCGHILRCMPCCVLCSTEHQPSCSPSAGHPHTCRFQRHFPWAQQKRATCDVSAVFLVCKGMTRLRCEDIEIFGKGFWVAAFWLQ